SSVCCEIITLSNLNRKIAGGDSHPTTKNERVQIVDAASVLTCDGKQRVAIGSINAESCAIVDYYTDVCKFVPLLVIFGFEGFQIMTNTMHSYETTIILSEIHAHSNITFCYS
ncbi:MAG: hypothetical protein EZS28_054830, partial [Streblomastix strix]